MIQQSDVFAHYPNNWVQQPTPAQKKAARMQDEETA
jgi:hypothetical protein